MGVLRHIKICKKPSGTRSSRYVVSWMTCNRMFVVVVVAAAVVCLFVCLFVVVVVVVVVVE